MADGWVIFPTESDYQLIHNAEKLAQSYPLVSRRRGKVRAQYGLTHDIALPRPKIQGTLDRTVAVHIIPKYWPTTNLRRYTFLTRDQVSEYFNPDLD